MNPILLEILSHCDISEIFTVSCCGESLKSRTYDIVGTYSGGNIYRLLGDYFNIISGNRSIKDVSIHSVDICMAAINIDAKNLKYSAIHHTKLRV